ncbi:MAG: polyurethanase [endosymbiont of Galathealinum brachiosum]|uniref:Polyurethanase n=1 Tax=endosymbiont of Galathealinum brachiosum TaxID=2200906 RepID=A0A370DIH7_9GAMM|nr:MAG: polyurethanase [endosymbiont of Galathealinum brachiosum]
MIEENAVVIDVNEQQVLLETQRKSACQSCSVKSGCGTSTLSKVVGNRSSQFAVDNTLDVKVGDTVVVAIDENALVQGSLLIYLFPLIFMMMFGILVEYFFSNELITIASVVSGFVFAMILVRRVMSGSGLKKSIQPHLIRRV